MWHNEIFVLIYFMFQGIFIGLRGLYFCISKNRGLGGRFHNFYCHPDISDAGSNRVNLYMIFYIALQYMFLKNQMNTIFSKLVFQSVIKARMVINLWKCFFFRIDCKYGQRKRLKHLPIWLRDPKNYNVLFTNDAIPNMQYILAA